MNGNDPSTEVGFLGVTNAASVSLGEITSLISLIKSVPDETFALLPTLEADAVDDEDADQPVKLVLKRTVFVTTSHFRPSRIFVGC